VAEKSQTQLTVTSTAFNHGQMIPSKYTCDGENVSPDISWEGAPIETKSLVLIAEDSDVPMKGLSLFTFAHWVVYNIPPIIASLTEAIPKEETINNEVKQGLTGFRKIGYGGPCPPFGTHRYYFKLYALDTVIELEPRKATKKSLLHIMDGHIIACGELMGRYKRHK